MDHIAELKKFKAPKWAVWLGRWRAWKRRRFAARQWRQVAVVTAWAGHTNHNRQVAAWYTLYERGDGTRTSTFRKSQGYGLKPEETFIFNQVIKPWLDHKHDNGYVRDVAKQTFNAP